MKRIKTIYRDTLRSQTLILDSYLITGNLALTFLENEAFLERVEPSDRYKGLYEFTGKDTFHFEIIKHIIDFDRNDPLETLLAAMSIDPKRTFKHEEEARCAANISRSGTSGRNGERGRGGGGGADDMKQIVIGFEKCASCRGIAVKNGLCAECYRKYRIRRVHCGLIPYDFSREERMT